MYTYNMVLLALNQLIAHVIRRGLLLKIVIFEGARGTGKSTVASMMRQRIQPTTLMNLTGFGDDGEEGLLKIQRYYFSWMMLIESFTNHESVFIFDRFYFSEMVYSSLYKNYNFKETFNILNSHLSDISKEVELDIIFLTINDEEELKERLQRDKITLFGSTIEESVDNSLSQQEVYKAMFEELEGKFNIHTIDTSGKTNNDVYDEIMVKI